MTEKENSFSVENKKYLKEKSSKKHGGNNHENKQKDKTLPKNTPQKPQNTQPTTVTLPLRTHYIRARQPRHNDTKRRRRQRMANT